MLTKSPLLLRDLDAAAEIAEVAPVSANLSVPTLDEKAWRATEPHTPNPRARLEAVAELNRAGIPTGVLVAPLMPGHQRLPEQVEAILELATEAGATTSAGIALHLRGEVREVFIDWLRSHRPDLVAALRAALRARRVRCPTAERERLQRELRQRAGAGGRRGSHATGPAEVRRRDRGAAGAAARRRGEEVAAQTAFSEPGVV